MIRCSVEHKDRLLDYLYKHKEMNLFMIGDIINYGFDSKFQTVFMDVDREINSVYLIYHDSLVLASNFNTVDKMFVSRLIDEYEIKNISGPRNLIDQLDNIDGWRKQECFFASIDEVDYEGDTNIVTPLKREDISMLVNGLNSVFTSAANPDMIRIEINDGTARHYVVYDENKVVSHAGTSAECDGLAMIIGVFTLPEYRQRQNAIKCVSKLCKDLLEENKKPCLFYSNPDAARMYKKIGFKDVGEYTLLKKG